MSAFLPDESINPGKGFFVLDGRVAISDDTKKGIVDVAEDSRNIRVFSESILK